MNKSEDRRSGRFHVNGHVSPIVCFFEMTDIRLLEGWIWMRGKEKTRVNGNNSRALVVVRLLFDLGNTPVYV